MERSDTVVEQRRGPIVGGTLVMIAITLVLFFLPLVNGLVGGLVGGYFVGGVKRSLLAAILPALVVAAGLWLVFALFEAPVLGFFAGMAMGLWILLADVGLFIGAAIGGALGNARAHREVAHVAR